MITVDRKNKLITLHTKNTTYQMKVWDCNILLHSYYGSRVTDGDLSYLLRRKDRGFSPNPSEAGLDRTFSLDTFPREYSTSGVGDFRLPSIELELPGGSRFGGGMLRGGRKYHIRISLHSLGKKTNRKTALRPAARTSKTGGESIEQAGSGCPVQQCPETGTEDL